MATILFLPQDFNTFVTYFVLIQVLIMNCLKKEARIKHYFRIYTPEYAPPPLTPTPAPPHPHPIPAFFIFCR